MRPFVRSEIRAVRGIDGIQHKIELFEFMKVKLAWVFTIRNQA